MNNVILLCSLLTLSFANTIIRPDNNGGLILGDGPVVTYDTVMLQGTAYPNELDLLLQDQSALSDLRLYNLDSLAIQRLPGFSSLAATVTVDSATTFLVADSTVYKFNTSSNSFVSFQTLSTTNNKKWTSFTIGTSKYMIYANSAAASTLYLVTTTGFSPIQSITTPVVSWEYLFTNNSHFLVGATLSNTLNVYTWGGSTFTTPEKVAYSVSSSIYAIDSFTSQGTSYVAVSMYTANNVIVYSFNGATFTPKCTITSSKPSAVKFYTINNVEYLIIAETGKGNNTVYLWNNGTPTQLEMITIDNLLHWEFFNFNNQQYLVSARSVTDTVTSYSYLYKWNGYTFDKMSQITTVGAFQSIFIMINNVNYLFVNCKSTFTNAQSILYQLQ